MKHLLIILSFLLLSSPVIGQSERPETIIVPVSSMGDVSDTRKQILQNTLTDELKKYFRIVPQEKYEQVLEQVFEELEYEECSEHTCIMRAQELLHVFGYRTWHTSRLYADRVDAWAFRSTRHCACAGTSAEHVRPYSTTNHCGFRIVVYQ